MLSKEMIEESLGYIDLFLSEQKDHDEDSFEEWNIENPQDMLNQIAATLRHAKELLEKQTVVLFVEGATTRNIVDYSTGKEIDFRVIDYDVVENWECPICRSCLDEDMICPVCKIEASDEYDPDKVQGHLALEKKSIDVWNANVDKCLKLLNDVNDNLFISRKHFFKDGIKYHVVAGNEMDWINESPYYVISTDSKLEEIYTLLSLKAWVYYANVYELRDDKMIRVARYQRPHVTDLKDPNFVEFKVNLAGF